MKHLLSVKGLILSVFFSLLSVSTAHAVAITSNNLIENGGFEQTHVEDGSWKLFNADNVLGWQGSNIEIWDDLTSFHAYEGEQFAELNSHFSGGNAFSIFQTFETVIGNVYDVSFAYSARRNTNEAFKFDLFTDDDDYLSTLIDDHTVNNWSTYSTQFLATGIETALMFTSVTPMSKSVGNFLDDVVVTQSSGRVANIPEPNTIILLLLALIGLSLYRKVR